MATTDILQEADLFGIGSYTLREAARLLRTPAINISRWMKGYSYRRKGQLHHLPPLWRTQWHRDDDHIEIGFRDLVELRFVTEFTEAGIGLLAIRNCLDFARELVKDDHPFSREAITGTVRTGLLSPIQWLRKLATSSIPLSR
jgi:hypothetical protein